MHQNKPGTSYFTLFWVVMGVALLFLVSLFYGSTGWSFSQEHWASPILWELRLPRTLMALLAGAGLAMSGFWLQLLFKNPLASPSVLGVTNGASLGVAFVTMSSHWIFGSTFPELSLLASFIGAAAVLLLLAIVRLRLQSMTSLLIFGVMVGHLAGALETVFQRAASRNDIPNLIYWAMGSFAKSSMYQVWILLGISIVTVVLILRKSKSIDIFSLGEPVAISMGVQPRKVANVLIFAAGCLTAVITSFCGPIAFIGLASPHLAKLWWSPRKHATLLPAVIVTGMMIALLCDILARAFELPINAITSLIGAPWVMWWLYKNKNLRNG